MHRDEEYWNHNKVLILLTCLGYQNISVIDPTVKNDLAVYFKALICSRCEIVRLLALKEHLLGEDIFCKNSIAI